MLDSRKIAQPRMILFPNFITFQGSIVPMIESFYSKYDITSLGLFSIDIHPVKQIRSLLKTPDKM